LTSKYWQKFIYSIKDSQRESAILTSRGSLALVMRINGTENFGRFGKSEKKGNTWEGITFFPKQFR